MPLRSLSPSERLAFVFLFAFVLFWFGPKNTNVDAVGPINEVGLFDDSNEGLDGRQKQAWLRPNLESSISNSAGTGKRRGP
jgi:hypothetical protein